MDNRTLLNVFEYFENSHSSKDVSLIQSALFRFTLPGLTGRKPSGGRLTSKEIAAIRKTLDSILISPDIGERLRQAQEQTFKLLNTPKERKRQPRSYLNQFIEWATNNRYFPFVEPSTPEEEYSFRNPRKICSKAPNTLALREKFTFSFEVNDYTQEPLDVEQIQQHLDRVKEEVDTFKKYLVTIQGNRASSAGLHGVYLERILGWLYKEMNVPLSEISLSKLVPFINLNPRINKFSHEENALLSQMLAKAQAQEEIKDEANNLVDLMVDFFSWLKHSPAFKTKQIYIEALMAYSKYVYRNETDKTMALNFEDIPIVNRLKVFHKEIGVRNKQTSSSSSNTKYLPWSEIVSVLEKLRFEADLETITQKRKRRLRPRAISLQKFVLLGFFVLVPPPRQRVIRELELGRTLKYGLFENGRFTPSEKMDNPSEAKYYIHLQPEDYKTGDIYGEWLGEFPNVEFPDGSTFYAYLNRWFFQGHQDTESKKWYGMRQVIASEGERTVFVTERAGIMNQSKSIWGTITNIFIRWKGVAINPHELRHLYRTHIDDPATGATSEEKESAAYWMRHSSETASKIYSHLNSEQKLRAGAQLSERLNQQFLGAKN